MDLETELKKMLQYRAMDQCFSSRFFDICPINDLHNFYSYPHRKALTMAHCIHFKDMSDSMIAELRVAVREAVYYKKRWYNF
jgi:hypothetical protein